MGSSRAAPTAAAAKDSTRRRGQRRAPTGAARRRLRAAATSAASRAYGIATASPQISTLRRRGPAGAYPGDRGPGAHREREEQDRQAERDQRSGPRREVQPPAVAEQPEGSTGAKHHRKRRGGTGLGDPRAQRDGLDEQQSGRGSGERRPDTDQDARAPARRRGAARDAAAGRRRAAAPGAGRAPGTEVSTSDIARQACTPSGERAAVKRRAAREGNLPGRRITSYQAVLRASARAASRRPHSGSGSRRRSARSR